VARRRPPRPPTPKTWTRRTWLGKFGDAFRGIARAVLGQSSFAVHIPAALGTLALAAILRVSLIEWCVLAGAIGAVLAAEVINTSIEMLAKAVTEDFDPFVRDALDIASAGVMVTVVTAVVIGTLLIGNRVGILLGLW
jgi:diacylglycerol kinase